VRQASTCLLFTSENASACQNFLRKKDGITRLHYCFFIEAMHALRDTQLSSFGRTGRASQFLLIEKTEKLPRKFGAYDCFFFSIEDIMNAPTVV